jgi:hypothetical protein
MLRPGTKLPHPATVSRDIQAIYLDMSKHLRNYFQVSFYIIMRRKNMNHEFIFRHATAQSILLWMGGLRLLLHPFLELWLSGMKMVLYIVQF